MPSSIRSRHPLPSNMVFEDPSHRRVTFAAKATEDQSQHQVTHDPAQKTGRLAVAVPPALGNDAFDAIAPEMLVRRKGILDARLVAQAGREDD
jgi:hypothetical protein